MFRAFWVYPRVCGGTVESYISAGNLLGLSPRVRGNRVTDGVNEMIGRSIPACAGEPMPITIAEQPVRVYPRVCGGTTGLADEDPPIEGLSPRVRGNLVENVGGVVRFRSIPACAGEPFLRRRSARRPTVYPRVCGGTSVASSLCRP